MDLTQEMRNKCQVGGICLFFRILNNSLWLGNSLEDFVGEEFENQELMEWNEIHTGKEGKP